VKIRKKLITSGVILLILSVLSTLIIVLTYVDWSWLFINIRGTLLLVCLLIFLIGLTLGFVGDNIKDENI
jgi:hypothetical protein